MGAKSRRKGKVGEGQACSKFVEAGIPCERAWEDQSKPGGQLDGDLRIGKGTPLEGTIYAEVRRRERWDLQAWLRELAEKCNGRKRLLIFRRNHGEWHVALPLDEYLDLLKRSID